MGKGSSVGGGSGEHAGCWLQSEAALVQALSILFYRPELRGWGETVCVLLCPSHTPQAGFILSFKGVLSQNTEAKPFPKLQGL